MSVPVGVRWEVGAFLGLTAATGLIDAVSYLKLGHTFVANMTGNVVFLGFAVAQAVVLWMCALLVGPGVLRESGGTSYLLIAALAACFGLQNATVRHVAPRDMTTTVLTLTLDRVGRGQRAGARALSVAVPPAGVHRGHAGRGCGRGLAAALDRRLGDRAGRCGRRLRRRDLPGGARGLSAAECQVRFGCWTW
ncbi:DUF1275 domain-containing protein [Kribbella sp. NBC_00709]|uniref:DUF1275 family protein n=1 Tax=Kribbella sp. NBC_00709 TaxID=2975972 RepID=UPI002E2C21E0|nr:DUF1275 family protein [Kribbella sp. NBC_00709]